MGCKASKEHFLFKNTSKAVPWDTLHQLDSCDSDFDPIEYVARIQEKQNRKKQKTKWGEHKEHDMDLNLGGQHVPTDDSSRFLLPPTALCSERETSQNNSYTTNPMTRFEATFCKKSMGTAFHRARTRLKTKAGDGHRHPCEFLSIRRRSRNHAPKTYGLVAAERYHFAHNQTFESLSSDASSAASSISGPLSETKTTDHHDGVFVGLEDSQMHFKPSLL